MSTFVLNIPNCLTLARLSTIPVVVLCIYTHEAQPGWLIAGVLVFVLAALLDKLDGYIARRFCQVTEFGMIWDPVVDKIWLHSIALAMCLASYVPALCVWLFLARDLVVTQLRNEHPGNATFKMADKRGKRKFRFQVLFLGLCMIRPWISLRYPSMDWVFLAACVASFSVAAYFTIASCATYIGKYAR